MAAIPLCNGGLSTTSLPEGHQHQPASLQPTEEPPATNRQTTSHLPAHGNADDQSQSQSQGLCQIMVYLYLQVPLAGCQRRPNGEPVCGTQVWLSGTFPVVAELQLFHTTTPSRRRLSAPHKTISWSVSGCTEPPKPESTVPFHNIRRLSGPELR